MPLRVRPAKGQPFREVATGVAAWVRNAASGLIHPADPADGWVVGSDRMDRDTADTTKNYRAFFNKAKGAFRAGGVTGDQWDDANVGTLSFASGQATASGYASCAEGTGLASATVSHAEGYNTKATSSYAHAEGDQTTASATPSHAEGRYSQASGSSSHAEGYSTEALGDFSHAEGQSTTASGAGSHAEGKNTTASGDNAHAEGSGAKASGNASHAEGSSTASGVYAHAENQSNQATGQSSHAEGLSTQTVGLASHAEGYGTYAWGPYTHAEGEYSTATRYAQYAKASGRFSASGDAQASRFTARQQTADGNPSLLAFNGATAASPTGTSVNVLTLLASRAHKVRIEVIARRTDVQGEAAGFSWEGVINRDATGNARILGDPVFKGWSDAAAAAWTLAVGINTTDATNNYLEILATGEAGKTIRWVASIDTVEVAG